MKIRNLTLFLLFTIFLAACKKTTPKNEPDPVPNLTVIIPFNNLGFYRNNFIPLPDQSFAVWASEDLASSYHFFHFDKDLKLLDTAIFRNTKFRNQSVVREKSIFSIMGKDLIETDFNFNVINQNTHIDKDLGLDSKTTNMVICDGPNNTLLLLVPGQINGLGKLVLALYDISITKPIQIIDTLSNISNPPSLYSMAFLSNKVYVIGYNDLSSRILWTMKQYDYNGKLNWINSDYNLEGYFWVLDSSLYLLGNRKVLEDGTIVNKFNGSLIYQNSLNGFTTFYSSLYSDPSGLKYTTGHIANLSSDYQVEKETKIKVDNGLYNTFGPVDKDSWVYISAFLDANDGEKRKLRLEKINKNLD